MNQEQDDFARRHPSLDRALREQIKGPVMDAAFRRQVMARIAAQRATRAWEAASPLAVRSRLRAQLLLQFANLGAVGLAAALAFGALWPRLTGLPATSALLQGWSLPVAIAFGGAVLLYGLRQVPLPGWARGWGI